MRLLPVAAFAAALASMCSATPLENALAVGQQPLVRPEPFSEDTQDKKKKKLKKALKNVRKQLREAEIIPGVVEDFDPWLFLNITWPNGKHANLGNTKKPSKLSKEPYASLNTGNYTTTSDIESLLHELSIPVNNLVLTMTDPDAPSRDNPIWSEMCHWIAVGLPVHINGQSTSSLSHDGFQKSLKSYKPPGPPPFTGQHRYIFIAWTPANKTNDPLHLVAPEDRQHWGTGKVGGGVKHWAAAMGLQPFAANFLFSQDPVQ